MSCINRGMRKVDLLTFATTQDAYGQTRTGEPTVTKVEMFVKTYSQKNVTDPRFVEVTDIGITKDFTITTSNQIVFDSHTYNVLFTIPSERMNQVFLRRIK